MNYWISQLGFWGYMRRFPLNPITMVGGVVVIGIIVLVLNAIVRRRKAEQFVVENAGAVLMTFNKKRIGDTDYADNLRITKLNGETARWFFVKPMVPALYLKDGKNCLELHAEWARGGGVAVKRYRSDVEELQVEVQAGNSYSLEYNIPEAHFIFSHV